MRKTIAALAVSLGLFLSACSTPVTAGDVVEKEFTEAYQTEEEIMEEECEWDTDTVTTGTGTKKTTKKVKEYECEDVGTGEYETIDHPAVYEVTLEDAEGNTETHEVTEAEYNSVEEGEFFDTGKGEQ